jgi:chromosomal replication initiator protein
MSNSLREGDRAGTGEVCVGHGLAATAVVDDVERAWSRIRTSLRESAGARLFDQWLKPVELVSDACADTVRLALPSQFMADWVRNHYADRLLLEFRQALPGIRAVLSRLGSRDPHR